MRENGILLQSLDHNRIRGLAFDYYCKSYAVYAIEPRNQPSSFYKARAKIRQRSKTRRKRELTARFSESIFDTTMYKRARNTFVPTYDRICYSSKIIFSRFAREPKSREWIRTIARTWYDFEASI